MKRREYEVWTATHTTVETLSWSRVKTLTSKRKAEEFAERLRDFGMERVEIRTV